MKRFIIKLSAFLLLMLAILSLCEVGFRVKPNPFKDKYKGLERNAAAVEILALGHSHANEGIDPGCFSHKAYNMAMGFQNVYFDDYILNHFIDRMDSLKCVVISMSYYHFYNPVPEMSRMQGENRFNTLKYHMYWGLDSVRGEKLSALDPSLNLEVLNNPASGWIAMAKYYLTGSAFSSASRATREAYLGSGFSGQYVEHPEAYLDEDGTRTALAHEPDVESDGFLDSSFNYPLYEHIVQVCEARGVKVLLVLFPCWHTYVEGLNREQLQDTRRLMQKLAADHANCMALDMMSDSRFDSSDFHDAIHLNAAGAGKMSAILDGIINRNVYGID